MARRSPMRQSSAKKLFSRTASKTHKKNVPSRVPMRGGIRM